MVSKYYSINVNLFRPETTTVLPEDVEELTLRERRVVVKSQVRESDDQERLFQGDGKDNRVAIFNNAQQQDLEVVRSHTAHVIPNHASWLLAGWLHVIFAKN